MAHKIKQCSLTSFLILLTSFKLLILVNAKPQVPCYFIFGDSLVDNGNNNMLQTDSKANYPPYGIDFRDGPTGRFTNGRTSADILGELLGFRKYIPPFATARGLRILKGINYASGGSGIRPETGRNLGEVINLDQQLKNHGITISNITYLQGNNNSYTKEYLNKCIYTVGMGGNDYKTNYLLPEYYPTSSKYTPDQFAAELIKQYGQQLKTLYNYGARKVVVYGVRPVGCTPQSIAQYGANASGCVDFINDYVQHFNNKIKPLIDDLNMALLDAHYIYINVSNFSPPKGIANNYPCCTVSTTTHKGQCVPYWVPCGPRLERASRASWDEVHPTETEHKLIARRSYSALSPFDAYPFDIRRLALL